MSVCVDLGAHARTRTRTRARARAHTHTRAFKCIQDICVNVCTSLCGCGYAGCRAVHAPPSQPACKANKVRLLNLCIDRDREAIPVAPVLRASRRQEGVWNAAPLDPCAVHPCDRCVASRFLFAIISSGPWFQIFEDCKHYSTCSMGQEGTHSDQVEPHEHLRTRAYTREANKCMICWPSTALRVCTRADTRVMLSVRRCGTWVYSHAPSRQEGPDSNASDTARAQRGPLMGVGTCRGYSYFDGHILWILY